MKRLDPATLPLENLDKVEEYLNQLPYDIHSDSLEVAIERQFGLSPRGSTAATHRLRATA